MSGVLKNRLLWRCWVLFLYTCKCLENVIFKSTQYVTVMPKSRTISVEYISGHFYVCAQCKTRSRQFVTAKGMHMWKRLHFRFCEKGKLLHTELNLEDHSSKILKDCAGKMHNEKGNEFDKSMLIGVGTIKKSRLVQVYDSKD